MQSKKYKLNKQDLLKIGKGAVIALIGALLTYVASIAGNIDFGAYTPIVVAVLAIVVNAGRKFIASEE